MYLICENGYLPWPTSICPHVNYDAATVEGYFAANLESVQKDVECTSCILKKHWKILNNGLHHRDIKICEKSFIACCCLNNFLLDLMERNSAQVGRGFCLAGDAGWMVIQHLCNMLLVTLH